MKKLCILGLVVLGVLLGESVWGQTNPTAHSLSTSGFSFTGFASGMTVTYPTSMQGWKFAAEPTGSTVTSANGDRVLEVSTAAVGSGNIRNEVTSGLSLLNSSSNNIGAIVVALNTTNRENITVSWVAQQLTSGGNGATDRISALQLQYRIGSSGDFTTVAGTEYLGTNTTSQNAEQSFSNIGLPGACNNVALVQVRWIYYISSGTANSRDRIRLDEININSTAIASCTPPTTQAFAFGTSNILSTQMDAAWMRGNGANVLVVARSGSAVNADPVNAMTYTASTTFGSGTQIGTGNYVVYNGIGSSVTVTGLTQSTAYHYAVYEYGGTAGSECYRASDELTGNAMTLAGPSITVTPSTLTGFTYIAGAGPSASQSYTLSGANLDPAADNITVAASANYEVSIDDATYTSSSFTVPYTASTLANTTIYVRLKAGLSAATYNGEAIVNSGGGIISDKNVTCSGSVTTPPPPTITVTPTTRTGFTYITGAGPSTSQTYTLSGANLDPTAGNLTVAASANYEVSSDNMTFISTSFNVPYTGGTLTNTTIYVRLKAGLTAGTYNSEAVVNSGGNATSQNVTCSGSVIQPPSYFRTKASGLWSEIATWEVSTDQMTWSNATAAPTTMDLAVNLVSPHNVTVNTSVSADQLTIQSGSTLELASAGTLSIANGTGTDLLVEGIFINGGSFIYSGVLEVATGGIYKHNPASAGGTIPSFTWSTGSTCEVIKASGRPTNLTQSYANFTWNNTLQSSEINLNGELISISGNFYVQSTGSSSLRMIGSGQTTTVGGNLEVAAGAILNLSGTGSNQIINLSGNLILNGTLTEFGTSTNSRIVFSGTSAATIGGSGLISNTVNFEINKTAGGSVALSSDFLLPSNFTFVSGQVRTNGFTFGVAGTITGASSAAYFCTCNAAGTLPATAGGLRMSQAASGTVLYPVGPTTSYYMPVTLTSGAGHTTDNFTVRVETLGTGGVTPTDNTKCVQYQWDIAESVAGGSDVQVKLQWVAGTEGLNFDPVSAAYIGHWSGSVFNPVYPASYAAGGPSVTSTSNFTSFSPFVVSSSLDALPIELLSFNAIKQSTHTLLSFATASERNNERFEIERSADGRTYQVIGAVKGAGNAQTQNNYTFTDEHPLRGINYYRLRQVDFDGASALSQVVSVTFGKAGNVVLYPTPASETMHVRFDEAFTTDANWQIVDLTGRILNEGIFAAEQVEFRIPVASLTQGAYILRVTANNEVVTQQFRKQ